MCKQSAFEAIETINSLSNFNHVFESCFGNGLDPTYLSKIKGFQDSFLANGPSITPKARAVFYHVHHFVSRNKC